MKDQTGLKKLRQSRSWFYLRKSLPFLFIAIVAAILYSRLQSIEWSEVAVAIRSYSFQTMAVAGILTLTSYLLFVSYEVLAKRYTGHRLSTGKVAAISFVCYSFNLSLGALIGGFGFRYLLYSRFGIEAKETTQIIGFSVLTNWLGYILLTGFLLFFVPPSLPSSWGLPPILLTLLGAALIVIALGYFLATVFLKRRTWNVKNVEARLPSPGMALLQFALSVANWLCISLIISVLFKSNVPFASTAVTYLLSGLAGVLTHVPAGLGVLEAVFLEVLGNQVAASQIIATLLAFRAVFYLTPLIVGVAIFLVLGSMHRSALAASRSKNHTHGGQRVQAEGT